MNILDLAIARKSVRTFDGNKISNEEINKILEYCKTIKNPYNIPVEFLVLDAEKHGLSSPVITGGNTYITAKVPKIAHCEEALGYSFELMVLYAWSLGIGTTWIGGTMNRDAFEKASQLKDDEIMPCVSPLGYPAKKRSLKEIGMRTAIRADKRISEKEMFFENDFSTPLIMADAIVKNALEAVKYAPPLLNR